MLFSIMNRGGGILLAGVLALVLAGCGTKQGGDSRLELIEPVSADAGGEALSQGELAALKSTGHIDKDIPSEAMPEVAAQYKYFLRKGRNTMCVFSKRSEQYLAYARKVFRERGMPEELANLAIVESGYRPNAVSHAGAAGAWQFMPGTGKMYGLKQDWWLDERLDPYKATEAAADYLQKLHDNFGDWSTAIAAYNAGEGKMARAKEGVGAKNFFEVTALNHKLDEKTQLREETRQYVPRFMAVTKIMRNLPDLGFDAIEPEKTEKVTRFTARPGTDLRGLSRAVNMDWKDFQAMNQHHKRHITCTDSETFVYVPERVKALARNYLCSAQKASFAGWRPVKVASSKDSLENMSRRSNIPLERLQAANPGLGKLKAGQIILAPANLRMAQYVEKTVNKTQQPALMGRTHVFSARDTLFSVARRYNTTVAELKTRNGIQDAGKIRAGAVLAIPGAAAGTGADKKAKKKVRPTYTVREKDNLWSIARKHNTTVDELRRWNSIDGNKLKPGSILVVASE